MADIARQLSDEDIQSLGTYIQGLHAAAPAEVALLRLDTDWYESTRHELEHLFPRLVPGGVLIIDLLSARSLKLHSLLGVFFCFA